MPASRRLLTVLACAASVGAVSGSPASAASSNGQGVVLSSGGHLVRLVDKAHHVRDVRVSSTRGLHRGDVVRVRRGKAHVGGHARRVSFIGRVVRSSRGGAVVRLGDGSTFKFSASRKRHGRRPRAAANVTIDLQGLTPGQALLITIATDVHGNVAITIKLLPPGTSIGAGDDDRSGPGDEAGCGDEAADDETADDEAETANHDDRSSDDDTCSDDPGDDDWLDEVDGTVTALADDGSSLTLAPDDGSAAETYPVDDPSLLDGIAVGDEVAVTLDEDGTAIDVELLDWADEDPGPGDDGPGDNDGGDE